MRNKKLAKRYAKALIEIGQEKDQVKVFQDELRSFADLLGRVPELEESLLSPLYTAEDLKNILAPITAKLALSETIQNFLYLLVDKRRTQYFPDIVEAYEEHTREIFGYVKAKVTTATALSDKDSEEIEKALEEITQKKVLVETVVDPQIIGGVIAEVGDKIFDGSIHHQLQKLGETLI
jgi:F-type H+-transporting ATPase subunit delta